MYFKIYSTMENNMKILEQVPETLKCDKQLEIMPVSPGKTCTNQNLELV